MEVLRQMDFTLGPLYTTFLLGLATFSLFFWYSIRKQSYWKKIGIPYAKPIPFLGSVLENIEKPLHKAILDQYNELGKIYGYYEGNRPFLSVAEPELLRNILVKDFPVFPNRKSFVTSDKIIGNILTVMEGEDWKRVRSIITPTFTTGKIKRMLSIFKDCSLTLVKNFRVASEQGKTFDAKRVYGAFTMDIIASSAFSTKIDSHNDPNNKFVATARAAFTRSFFSRFMFFFFSPKTLKLLGINVLPPNVMEFFTSTIIQIMEERKRTGQTRNDFLQLLMDTAKEVGEGEKVNQTEKDVIVENYGEVDHKQELKHNSSKKSLSIDELVAQCILFFLAGYNTTSSTLSFASYLLALNPDSQEKLIQEIDDTLTANDGELNYDAIQSMKYLDNVIAETLRMFPPEIRLERSASENYKLGDTGLTVPKGMVVTVPVYAIHRDPKLFPEPEKFNPDRFSPEERAKRNPYTYMPFGAGPRNCVGMRFALMEIKVCLVHVLSHFRIKKSPQTKEPLEWYNGQGLVPKEITLSMEVREDTVKAF